MANDPDQVSTKSLVDTKRVPPSVGRRREWREALKRQMLVETLVPGASVPISPDQLPDDTQALKRIIAAMAQDAVVAQAEIAKLRFQLARYRRAEFGRSSEKVARDAEHSS